FIIFQPELRQGLERLGNSRLARTLHISTFTSSEDSSKRVAKEITKALEYLSERRTGALIVLERQAKLNNVISTGVSLNSYVTSELLCNIFTPLAPLHDGAVIIRNEKIIAASCLLPNTQRTNLDSSLGTRHRAAIGITEVSDALVVVVSEETGRISIAVNGIISRGISIETAEGTISKLFSQEAN
ncbi:diadenylate cyclase CdaA, partial [Treponema sp. R6D11]